MFYLKTYFYLKTCLYFQRLNELQSFPKTKSSVHLCIQWGTDACRQSWCKPPDLGQHQSILWLQVDKSQVSGWSGQVSSLSPMSCWVHGDCLVTASAATASSSRWKYPGQQCRAHTVHHNQVLITPGCLSARVTLPAALAESKHSFEASLADGHDSRSWPMCRSLPGVLWVDTTLNSLCLDNGLFKHIFYFKTYYTLQSVPFGCRKICSWAWSVFDLCSKSNCRRQYAW